ncbi:carboxypeptidase-like regulatory domain-containing protein [Galbitalea sp. SE-J8]|uniref:carboxypeptidase-like regulatory domain-containing protein n=1 Tax=Galbitalea sp. SE-J8 TaxID=3054952 RepID=UPI00259C881B|nr:carboxypeptidase-like regulatory domain-containing protein [Galbitalea sp. SE-J8]MDM4763832.1 carboxypeptidase-like regulatory domain-containing protein [Galbitalea sp. SE-J8]
MHSDTAVEPGAARSRPLRRLVSAAVAIAAVAASVLVAPATADAAALVSLVGHVRGADGVAFAGVKVEASWDKDVTSRTGRFALRVPRANVNTAYLRSQPEGYLPPTNDQRTARRVSATKYVVDFVLPPASIVRGRVTDDTGEPVPNILVWACGPDGSLADGVIPAETAADGSYTLEARAGDYRLRYFTPSGDYRQEWYGGVTDEAASPIVHLDYAQQLAGYDAQLTELPHIDGHVTIDGAAPLPHAPEAIATVLRRADGTLVDLGSTLGTFHYGALDAGDYSLTVRPKHAWDGFTAPVTIPLTVSETSSVEDLAVPLTMAPDWIAKPGIVATVPTSRPKKGAAFRVPIRVESYQSVRGARVTVFAGRKRLGSRTLPASGRITFGTRFTGVAPGAIAFRIVVSPTADTQRSGRSIPLTLRR